MIEFARSPVVNVAFDDYRRDIYGDKLITADRLEKLVAGFTAGMKPAAVASLRSDPYFGIASKGRTGAAARFAAQSSAFAREVRKPKETGRVFKSDARNKRYLAALADGTPRADAMKLARRVSVPSKRRFVNNADARATRDIYAASVRNLGARGTPTGRHVGKSPALAAPYGAE